MAITSLSEVISGLRTPVSFVSANSNGNNPGLQTIFFSGSDSTTIGGVAVTSTSPFRATVQSYLSSRVENPSTGKNAYLSKVSATGGLPISGSAYSNAGGIGLILCDVLWVCGVQSSGSAIAVDTSLQTINSVSWPSRDNNQSINGEGVYIGLGLTSNLTLNGGSATITYTNSAGVSGRSGLYMEGTGALREGTFSFFSLESGDLGVKSVQTFQFDTSHTAGTVSLVALRPIATIPLMGTTSTIVDSISLCMPRIYDNSILGYVILSPTSDHTVGYTYSLSHG